MPVVLVLVLVLAVACARPAERYFPHAAVAPAAPAKQVSAPEAQPRDYPGALFGLPPLISPALAPWYDAPELDPRNMYALREQEPKRSFRGLPRQRAGRFPGVAFASVRAFVFAGDRAYPSPPHLDPSVPGCGVSLVAKDGTFCPSVVYPGRSLSKEQIDELIAIVTTRDPVYQIRMNGYSLTRGFVFLDAEQRPVAQIVVGPRSRKLYSQPSATVDGGIDYLGGARGVRLDALLIALGILREPIDDSITHLLYRQRELDGFDHSVLRWLPTTSGVDGATLERDLSVEQRRAVCAWYEQVWMRGSPRSGADGGQVSCDDGWRVIGTDFAECQAILPRCAAPIGEIEACMRRQRVDPCLMRASPRCRELRECLWGLKKAPSQ